MAERKAYNGTAFGANLMQFWVKDSETYRLNVIRQEDKHLICRHLECSCGQVLQEKIGAVKEVMTLRSNTLFMGFIRKKS